MQWLLDGLLGYSLKAGVQERQGFSAAQKILMPLSRETQEGLRMTGAHCYISTCMQSVLKSGIYMVIIALSILCAFIPAV